MKLTQQKHFQIIEFWLFHSIYIEFINRRSFTVIYRTIHSSVKANKQKSNQVLMEPPNTYLVHGKCVKIETQLAQEQRNHYKEPNNGYYKITNKNVRC